MSAPTTQRRAAPRTNPKAPQGARKRQAPRQKRPKKKTLPVRPVTLILAVLVIGGILVNLLPLGRNDVPRWVDVQIIDESSGGRPGSRLGRVNDIAIHYVGNPGSTAQQNRDFFDQLETQVSAHFVIGLEGEIIQCVPLDEITYATNERNGDTISIEVCHPDATGQFTQETYEALVKLTAWLCDHCNIGRDRLIRHHDVTGKLCPLYFVENPAAWEEFKRDVAAY